ncbi:MAG: hypothetical protein EBY41_00800 [Proteobacteria bacterium]|nr:hypothetical protein [Pseudomonadota bacterium]
MKLESKTIQVLKNFSTINPSMMFKPGTSLATVSPTKTVMAKAQIEEEIPSEFAIYDLSRFLGVISLFNEPALDVQDKFMTIKSGKQRVQYTFADPSVIVSPSKELTMPTVDIEVEVSQENLQSVQKALGVMGLPEIAITGKDDTIFLEAIDSKNPTNDTYSIEIGKTDKVFQMIIKSENLKIIPSNYVVSISSLGIAHFKGEYVEYWVATEAASSFTD